MHRRLCRAVNGIVDLFHQRVVGRREDHGYGVTNHPLAPLGVEGIVTAVVVGAVVPEKALVQFPAPRSTTAVSVFKVLVPPPMVVLLG